MRDDHNDRTVVQRTDPLLGGVIAKRFRIREKIAAGGFGAIYRAQHIASGHEVAIKVLHPQLAADTNVIERFRREGATLSKLRAPHTVTTYEFGETPDGMLYIVMELLTGVSLHERLRERGLLPWREALQIARAICISLAEAHALGIVHRDLKPANIHLETRGDRDYVKVLDFGIAKIKRGTSTDDQPELTNAGQMIGTIDYMAPEQILGGQTDGRSDLFTLGILLFEMIAGRRPFGESATPTSMLAALLTQKAPRLSELAPIPPSLDALVARCLQREANDRWASVDELAEEMDRILMSSSDDGQTRTIAIGLHTQKWEDEEATLMADATYRPHERSIRPPNTLEAPVPPAPQHTPPPQITPTPSPQRARPATTPPPQRPTPQAQRSHSPTPFPPYPFPQQPAPQWQTPMPPPQHPVDNSGWDVPRAGRASQPDPSAWQAYAGNATHGAPPVAPAFAPAERRSEMTTPAPRRTYDPNRDEAVGRIVWIVAFVIVSAIGFGIYKMLT